MTRRSNARLLALLAAAFVLCAAAPAAADCKADLVASQKALKDSGAAVEQIAASAQPGKCDTYRKHYAAMLKFSEVLGRCDTGAARAAHAAQLKTSIEDFRKKVPKACKV